MTIIPDKHGTPPAFKEGRTAPLLYALELEHVGKPGSASVLLQPGMTVQNHPSFHARYWEAEKVHRHMMAACVAAGADPPLTFGVFVSDTGQPVAVGSYRRDDSAEDRAFIDCVCLEMFLPAQTRTGTVLDGVLPPDQIDKLTAELGCEPVGSATING